jgi:hypothetical protein
MRLSLERRVRGVERARAAQRQMRFIWQDTDETSEEVQARIRARIASGEASPTDQFVTFSWRSPADDGADR